MRHMANVSQSEQLNKALDALLASRDSQLPVADSKLAPLLRVAASLRALPKQDFKARLKADLERRAIMASQAGAAAEKKVSYIREGFHTVTPYLIIERAAQFIEFTKNAFGAQERFRVARPGTSLIMHAEIQLGDSIVELADSTAQFPPRSGALHIFMPDVDSVYRRAVEAGAASLYAPMDQPYGSRDSAVRDSFGLNWYIATHTGSGPGTYVPEGLRTLTPYLHPKGAAQFIDFVKRAFGGEEVMHHEGPEGSIRHAEVRIGDSVIEISEARAEWPPMPMGLHLYVPNVDEVYERALKAGGISIQAPADQPYGDRSGGVRDAFGNQWFIATHMRDVHF